MSVAENIRKLRSRTKLPQQEIADLLKIDRNTYAKWEAGKSDIKSEYIPQLAKIFDVEIKELFQSSDSKIEISNNNHIGNDNALFTGAILILTNKENVDELVKILHPKKDKE